MTILRYVVHVLDKESETIILNDYEGKINQESEKFLKNALKKVLKNYKTNKLQYKNYSDNYIKNLYEDSIYNPKNFIQNSQIIANNFFEFINDKSEFNSSDIVIVLFSSKGQNMMAILNIEFKSNYTHTVEFLNEKFNVKMIENKNILTHSKVINAAVMYLSGANDEYHLKALTNNDVFIDDFLEATIVEDDTYKTQLFESITSYNLKTYATDIKQVIDTLAYRNYLLRNKTHINTTEFLEEIEEAGANVITKESLRNNFKNNDIEEFEIDVDYIEKSIKNNTLKTDTGFEIKCKSIDIEDPLKFKVVQNQNGSYDLIIRNIVSVV